MKRRLICVERLQVVLGSLGRLEHSLAWQRQMKSQETNQSQHETAHLDQRNSSSHFLVDLNVVEVAFVAYLEDLWVLYHEQRWGSPCPLKVPTCKQDMCWHLAMAIQAMNINMANKINVRKESPQDSQQCPNRCDKQTEDHLRHHQQLHSPCGGVLYDLKNDCS